MSEAWISVAGSVAVGILTLIGVLLSNNRAQAVTETKLEELTREVREHNNFARRMPALEQKIEDMSRRIENLERKGA